jgi:hypothetical protein
MDKAVAEGKAKRVCEINILELSGKVRVQPWIDDPDYEKWKDSSGALYAVETYKDGEQGVSLLKKELWNRLVVEFQLVEVQYEKSQTVARFEEMLKNEKQR